MTLAIRVAAVGFLACFLTGASSQAEVYLKSHPSPNEKYVVRVYWMSEAPDSQVTLLEGDKRRWVFAPDPRDKPVRVFWHPASAAFLMEHVTEHAEYRLYLVSIHKDHVSTSPITIDPKSRLASIVDGSIVWDQVDAGGGFTSLTIQGQDGQEHKMRIVFLYRLRPEDSGASSHTDDRGLSELSGVLKKTVKAHSPYKIELDGRTTSFYLRGDVLKNVPEGTRIRVWGRIRSRLFKPEEVSPWPIHWQIFMNVEQVKTISSYFDLPTTEDGSPKPSMRPETAENRRARRPVVQAYSEFQNTF